MYKDFWQALYPTALKKIIFDIILLKRDSSHVDKLQYYRGIEVRRTVDLGLILKNVSRIYFLTRLPREEV